MSIFYASRMVGAEDAARHMGIRFQGSRAFCPFHADGRHPALSFKDGRYRCFACDAHGDSIDLVAGLLDVKPLEAARYLNSAFSLGLSEEMPNAAAIETWKARKQEAERRKEAEQACYNALCWAEQMLSCAPDTGAIVAVLMRKSDMIHELLDRACERPMAERYALYMEYENEVKRIVQLWRIHGGKFRPILRAHSSGM